MAALRLTKAEKGLIRALVPTFRGTPKEMKTAAALIAKLDKSEAKPAGLDVKVAVEAFRGVLGTRLVLPLGAVWGVMQNRIRTLGLNEGDCALIAMAAAAEWRGPIKAESLVRQAERLLSGAPADSSTPRVGGGALEIGDDL